MFSTILLLHDFSLLHKMINSNTISFQFLNFDTNLLAQPHEAQPFNPVTIAIVTNKKVLSTKILFM